jgi:hypothetical protein
MAIGCHKSLEPDAVDGSLMPSGLEFLLSGPLVNAARRYFDITGRISINTFMFLSVKWGLTRLRCSSCLAGSSVHPAAYIPF